MGGPSDEQAIEQVNEAFYRAFEKLDLAAMDRVWAHAPHTACIHPGQEVLSGWDDVRQSFEAIFAGTEEIHFKLSGLRLQRRGDLAWATVVEHIRHGDDVLVEVQSTNLFERTKDGWRMILHHASPVSDEAGEPDTDFIQ
ncbi:MAG: nuclear transport factor 2 family protein [Deltaproteobacteria bacterium]